jgi:hypothetical protein
MSIYRAHRDLSTPADGEEHADVTIARLAARQHGVVSRRQLLAVGLSGDAIWRQKTAGRLHPVHHGVYAVGHPRLMRYARYMAAVLACGDRAVATHRSAAALLGLGTASSGPVDVTVPYPNRRRRSGIAVHVSRSLHPADVTEQEGIPCTTVARTLVDLAGVVNRRQLRRAVEQALVLRVFDRVALDAALGRAPGRRGTGTLRRLLAEFLNEPPLLRRELERRFYDLVCQAGLPLPVTNGYVAGHQVDFHWPAQRLIVETDGRAAHDHSLAFEADRRRDLDLEIAGWHVVRVTWRHVVVERRRLIALLRSRLAAPGRRPRPRGREAALHQRRPQPP